MVDGKYKNGETWNGLYDKRQLLAVMPCHQMGLDATKHNTESTLVAVHLLHTLTRVAANMLCEAIQSLAIAVDSTNHTLL